MTTIFSYTRTYQQKTFIVFVEKVGTFQYINVFFRWGYLLLDKKKKKKMSEINCFSIFFRWAWLLLYILFYIFGELNCFYILYFFQFNLLLLRCNSVLFNILFYYLIIIVIRITRYFFYFWLFRLTLTDCLFPRAIDRTIYQSINRSIIRNFYHDVSRVEI